MGDKQNQNMTVRNIADDVKVVVVFTKLEILAHLEWVFYPFFASLTLTLSLIGQYEHDLK